MAGCCGSAAGKRTERLGVLSAREDYGQLVLSLARIFSEEVEASFVLLTLVELPRVEVELPCGATVKVAGDRESLREVFAALLSVEANDA